MRIRSIKPEFWRSETIASVDLEARLILKGIESYVDDNGVGKDSVVLFCADVLPHDLARDTDTLAKVSRVFQKLCDADLIARYTLNGERLIYVRNWKRIQRIDKPNKGRYPRPDGTLEYAQEVDESVCAGLGATPPDGGPGKPSDSRDSRDTLANDSRHPRETVAPVTGEQRNRGTEAEEKKRAPAKPDAAKPKAVEQAVTESAYERVGKAFTFVAVRGIAKWAIHDRGANPDAVEDAIVGVYEMGKPITKQTVGQYLDGRFQSRHQSGGISRQDQKVQNYLNYGRPDERGLKEIGG